MKILLAVDGSPSSDAAVNEVADRPWPEGSEFKVICAIETPLAPAAEPWALSADYFEEAMKVFRETARKAIDSAVLRLRARTEQSFEISSDIVEASPKRAILDEAESFGADLIVVGSHGYGLLNRLLIGSVSQAIALHASCSVEIVRAPRAQDSETK